MKRSSIQIKKMLATALSVVTALGMLPSIGTTANAADGGAKAGKISVPEDRVLVSQTDYQIAPGLTESDVVTQNTNGDDQVLGYTVTFNSKDGNVGVMAGYNNYDGTKWALSTVMDQAKAAEKKTGRNIVMAVNGDSFNMGTGEPVGALVMNGVQYHDITWEPYVAFLKDGSCEIRESFTPMGPDVVEAIGSMWPLVRDGKIAQEVIDEDLTIKNPEVMIGTKANGDTVLYVASGRLAPKSCGLTHTQAAQIMISLGCTKAVKLDGGGSTTFATKREGEDKLAIRNDLSDSNERTLGSSLLFYSTAKPSGEFDHASISPNNGVYTPGSTVDFKAVGVDSAGGSAPLPADGQWELADDTYGTIDSSTGRFVASEKTGTVEVNYKSDGEIVGTNTIEIQKPDSIVFSDTEISVGFDADTVLSPMVKYKGRDINYNPSDIIFSLSDPAMGTISGNVFHSSDGNTVSGTVSATSRFDNAIKSSMAVTVGKLPTVVWDFEDTNYFTIDSEGSNFVTGNANRGNVQSAEIVNIDSNEPVRFGQNALKLNYDFTNMSENGTDGSYFGANADIEIPGSPTAVGVWVYAPEETANFWLRAYITDKNNTSPQPINFTYASNSPEVTAQGKPAGIYWSGWKYCEADLSAYTAPYVLKAGLTLRLMYVPGIHMGNTTAGSVYFDNMQFVYGTNIDDVDNPVINSVKVNTDTMSEELEDGAAFDTDKLSITANFSDVENKYTSGIDYSTVRAYIDGENVDSIPACDNKHFLIEGDNIYKLEGISFKNGIHSLKILLRDKAGNETSKTFYFEINKQEEKADISVEPISKKAILGLSYDMAVKSTALEKIKTVKTNILLNNKYSGYEVEFADGFDGTSEYNAQTKMLTVSATSKGTATGEGNIAVVKLKIPSTLVKGATLKYEIASGIYELTSSDDSICTFSYKPATISVEGKYSISANKFLVGEEGVIHITDDQDKPARGIGVYYIDNTDPENPKEVKLGTTVKNGTLTTGILADEAKKLVVYAKDNAGLQSFPYELQSMNSYSSDAKPFNILFNGTENATTTKNISWLANADLCEGKAVVQYATTEAFKNDGEAAFTDVTGTSTRKAFQPTVTTISEIPGGIAIVNSAKVSGLKENTEYTYRVGDGTNWSDAATFKTGVTNTNTKFFLLGDVQAEDITNTQKLMADIKSKNYMFGIQTGDCVDNALQYKYWNDAGTLLGANAVGNTDIIHVLGNHELDSNPEGDFAGSIYNLPSTGYGSRYSLTYGNVYVAVINYTTDEQLLKDNLEWMVEDASKSNATWKILSMHQPAYYTNLTGGNALINKYVPKAAQEAGLTAVFSGHDHSLARTFPLTDGNVDMDNGVAYFICGSTGEKSYEVTDNKDFHFDLLDSEFDAVYLSVETTDSEFRVNTYNLNSDGTVSMIENGTYVKNNAQICTGDDHKYLYVSGSDYLECSECGYKLLKTEYSGAVKDKETGRYMFLSKGEPTKNKWHADGEDTYYLGTDGVAVSGDYTISGKTYKFDKDGKYVRGAFVEEQVGDRTITRYYGAGGVLQLLWQNIDGDMYYFINTLEQNRGEMVVGEKNIPKNNFTTATRTFVFGEDGKLIKGAFDNEVEDGKYTGTRYYWGGDYITGDREIEGSKYHFDEDGYMTIKNISDCTITLDKDNFVYDGTAKKPVIVVKDGERVLTEKTEYTVEYGNNVTNANDAVTVTVKGANAYSGTVTKKFSIKVSDISGAALTFDKPEYTYSGKELTPVETVTLNGKVLKKDTDYTVEYKANTNVGTATVTVTGKGNYTGTVSKDFTIAKASIASSDSEVELGATKYYYTGNEINADVTVKFADNTLLKDTDYTVEYKNNTNVGTATVTVIGKGNYTGTVSKNYTITKASIASLDSEVKLGATKYYYTGKGINADVTVKFAGKTLQKDTDYTVEYKDNTNVGTATVTINGTGVYTGTVTQNFTIVQAVLGKDCKVTLAANKYYYTGKAIKPGVTVMLEGKALKSGTDYTVEYSNNVKVGTATVTVKAAGNYTGTQTLKFTIAKASLSKDCTVKLASNKYFYTGKAIKAGVSVKLAGKTLKSGTDYTVTYKNNIKLGTATVTLKGTGIYTGTATLKYTIAKASLSKDCTVKLASNKYFYTGKAIKAGVSVKLAGKTLKSGTNYTVTYKNNIKLGTATVTLKGTGIYTGTVTLKYTIAKASLSKDCTVKLGAKKYYLNTTPIIAGVSVKLKNKSLKLNKDFTVTYKNNNKVGTATAIIKGKGIYTGTVNLKFEIINRSLSSKSYSVDISGTKFNYTGKAIKPVVTVKLIKTQKVLHLNKQYTVTYKNNIKAGTATVTIKGTGIYIGTVNKTFKIYKKLAAPTKFKATSKKNSIVLNWGAVKTAKSYVIYKVNIKTGKATKYKVTTKNSLTISKLKANTKYSYKVCASLFANGALGGNKTKPLTVKTQK